MEMDLVSIVLPVYNCEKYIAEAIESVLDQTYHNIELIIIDDCSTDRSPLVINQFNDDRIRLLRNSQNRGIVYSLNLGFSVANGKYIARMDGDDICDHYRIEKQHSFMKDHPEVIIASCWFELFGARSGIVKFHTDDAHIRSELLFYNHFLHPGYFIDREKLLESGVTYREDYKYAEDYDFLERAGKYGSLANIPDVLMKYRVHDQQTSSLQKEKQGEIARRIHRRLFIELGIELTYDQAVLFEDICVSLETSNVRGEKIIESIRLLRLIIKRNKTADIYDRKALKEVVSKQIYAIMVSSLINNSLSMREYIQLLLEETSVLYKVKFFFHLLNHYCKK